MKISGSIFLFFCIINIAAFCKKGASQNNNSSPLVNLTAELISTDPFKFRFVATASDADNDPLEYTWDFGEGTKRSGLSTEIFSYPENMQYTVNVSVTDKRTNPVTVSVAIDTKITSIVCDPTITYQVMDGFGGFGAMDVYWSNGPFTSDAFVNTLINDLGVSILRDDIPANFEIVNDNNDPAVTDLTKFNLSNNTSGVDGKLDDHIPHLKKMHDAGLDKLVVSIWSAPAWMKANNRINNGTSQNSAPPYNENPGANDNQLRTDMYEEFAEMCVAYVRIIKQKTGIDLYALSIQNEPRFSQAYASCVYNGVALHDLLKVVGERFRQEGLSTKLFLPEDIGYLDGIERMIKPTLNDPATRQYADIVAVHGYDLDGVTANSPSAQTWQTMYSWGAPYNKPLWMTETSGFKNDWNGAMALAKAMYTAIRHGNVSAWLYWSISKSDLDEYSLMSSGGQKSKRYYVSKNFYRYIRPGAKRFSVNAPEDSKIYPLGFIHPGQNATTIILINDNDRSKVVTIGGSGLPPRFQQITTSSSSDCIESGIVTTTSKIILQPNSVTTLYWKN